MAHVVPKKIPEYLVDCEHCSVTVSYQRSEIQELWDPGWRDPVLRKSWIVCPSCQKKIHLGRD
jgi:hypothetical protein